MLNVVPGTLWHPAEEPYAIYLLCFVGLPGYVAVNINSGHVWSGCSTDVLRAVSGLVPYKGLPLRIGP